MWIESLTTLPILVLFGLCVWTNVRILLLSSLVLDFELNGWQLAKMKKSIPDMSLP